MSGKTRLRIGSRGSRLALAQSHQVADWLRQNHPGLETEVVIIQTTGDRILDAPLSKIGGKGVFTREVEEALHDGRIDLAVHSLKDVPTEDPQGLTLAAITAREDPRDVLIAREPLDLETEKLRVGTSSMRRAAQLKHFNSRLEIVEMRGNVPTRIGKMLGGACDAVVLAGAGVHRLGLDVPWMIALPPEMMLPAPGQGALGIQIRDNDKTTLRLVMALENRASAACCRAERAMLAGLGGGCQIPLGALAEIRRGELVLRGRVLDPKGKRSVEGERSGSPEDAMVIGQELARDLLNWGANKLLAKMKPEDEGFEEAVAMAAELDRGPLGGKRVLVTRSEDTDGPLCRAIKALGGQPICLPLVRHQPSEDLDQLRDALEKASSYDMLLITSPRAVDVVRAILRSMGRSLNGIGAEIVSVGEASTKAVERAGGWVALTAPGGTAESLLAELTKGRVKEGVSILYPRSNIARPELADGLRAAGARVDSIVAYRTVRRSDANAVGELFGSSSKPDCVTFCSPSAVEAFASSAGGGAAGARLLEGCVVVSIGPRTSETLQGAGIGVTVEAVDHTLEGVASALAGYCVELGGGE